MHHLQNCLNIDTPVTNFKKKTLTGCSENTNLANVSHHYLPFSKCPTSACTVTYFIQNEGDSPAQRVQGLEAAGGGQSTALNQGIWTWFGIWQQILKKIGVIRILKEVWAKALWLVGSFIPQQKNNPLKSGELCKSCRNWRLRSLGILFHFQKVKLK